MATAKQTLVLIDLDARQPAAGAGRVPRARGGLRRERERARGRRSRHRAGGDADDVLRAVVAALVTDGGCDWAGILFVENGELVLGPEAGAQRPRHESSCRSSSRASASPSSSPTAATTRPLLERVAARIAAYCLVGWDTGGVPWDPDA